MKWMWIFAGILLQFSFEGVAKTLNGKPLHLHMNKRELEHYFGSSDHSQVPDYDVVSPYHSNDDGGFVSYDLRGGGRLRRSLADLNRPSYKLRAFGEDLHLKLVRNDRLMAPGLQFEENLASGRISRSPAPENTFYLGHVASDPDSLVAVSNDNGLKGLIRHKEDSMFIHPLPDHLAKHFRTKRDTQPHLIYKTDQFTKRNVDEEDEESTNFLESRAFDLDNPRVRAERDVSNPIVGNVSNYKCLEIGLITDNLVAAKYGANNIANHLLLIGNILAGMFLDNSIGETKVVLVVRQTAVIHYDDIDGLNKDSSAGDKMTAMTNYMREKYKIEVDVYSFIASKVFGGLAGANTLCRRSGVGSIAADNGLHSAGIIAHEIGHTMGLGHDSSVECPSGTYIMAPVLPSGTRAYTWSPCSRKQLQEFLNGPRSSCLVICLDLPAQPALKIPLEWRDKLPGEIVSADQQCKYHYGNTSSHCSQMRTNCRALWCQTSSSSCASKNVPMLDGSFCGGENWCIRGECVDNGKPKIDGGWSDWSDFVPCNMKCGGGITYKERTCTNPPPQHGGKACEGRLKGHTKICNPEPCPEGQKSYRQQACEDWNPTAVPVYVDDDPCRLFCKKQDANRASKLGTVKDGARATKFSQNLDVCINGERKAVGCDHQLNSDVHNDRCGVCAGDGSSCSFHIGTFTENVDKGVENAKLIVELPIGVTRALFEENKETLDHIGIQDCSGSFLIDPLSKKSSVNQFAGTEVRHDTGRKERDKLLVTGPTNECLRIMFIRTKGNSNPDVKYEMYKPLTGMPGSPPTYDWVIPNNDVWTDCSAECAGGTQTRAVYCKRVDDQTRVGDQWCSAGNKPSKERECNIQPCQPEWHLSRWGDCSKTCGKGVQERSLVCRHKTKDLGFQQVADDLCNAKTKPNINEFKRYCRKIICRPPVWRIGQDWSQCSTSCDPGIATRTVLCVQTNKDGEDVVVLDILCVKDDKPPTQKACNLDNGCAPSETTCPPVPLCQNGATCVDDAAGYKCKCKKGYKGYFCEEQIDPCGNSPCLNGATCIQDAVNFLEYTCQCPIGYTGKNCEVRINPCDSSPCLNGGVCVPDDDVVLEYSCNCAAGHSGETCEVPPSYEIACLKYDANIYSVVLGNVKEVLDLQNTKPAIDLCRKLAHTQGYKNFALGNSDKTCVANPNTQTKIERKSSQSCVQGVGTKAVFAYTFDPLQSTNYVDLGCYKEKSKASKAALNEKLADLRTQPNGENGQAIVRQCAFMARDWGYDYFAVINREICVSSQDAANKYDVHGEITENVSDYCKDGVGLTKASMEVYQFQQQ